jgi:hypothetical protein
MKHLADSKTKKTIKNLGSEMKDPNWLFPYPRNDSHLNRAVRQLIMQGSTSGFTEKGIFFMMAI